MSRRSSRLAIKEKDKETMSRKSSRLAIKEKDKEDKKSTKEKEAGSLLLKWSDASQFFYVMDSDDLEGSTKIAAFDMDGTLIEPKSGKKFPVNRSDWTWWHKKVPQKLKQLHEDGFKIVIFTNQGGIEKERQTKSDITGKIKDIAEELGFPIQALVAAAENLYRKPNTDMWDYMVENLNHDVQPDLKVSFYCGDAGGRQQNWKKGAKKDISCSDRKFAANIGLAFHTPEELFLEEEIAEFQWDSIDPSMICETKKEKLKDSYHSDKQEMVIMVGPPASGKSTFTNKYFIPHNYERINRDTLGTAAKCKKATLEALSEGFSVVIDNTNGTASKRQEFIGIAQGAGIPVRCFYFTTDMDVVQHLNYVRVRETKGQVRRIPPVAYNTYKKSFEEPSKSEGFTEIINIDFVPDFKEDPHFEKIFKQWT